MSEEQHISNFQLWQRMGEIHTDVKTNVALFTAHVLQDDRVQKELAEKVGSLELTRAKGEGASVVRTAFISFIMAAVVTALGAAINVWARGH
jgi:hypothetical protein